MRQHDRKGRPSETRIVEAFWDSAYVSRSGDGTGELTGNGDS